LIAGCGAGACNVANSKKESAKSEMFSCSDEFAIFCNKEAASVAMSFISFLSSAFTAGLAYFRIHKVAKVTTQVTHSSAPNLVLVPATTRVPTLKTDQTDQISSV